MLKKIISGGQTGADQGALHGARLARLKTGGTAPRAWQTEIGPSSMLLKHYELCESSRGGYAARTLANVVNSDGTLVFGDITSTGTALTVNFCFDRGKPVTCVFWPYIFDSDPIDRVRQWIEANNIEVLNVAGNRESKNPGIHVAVKRFIVALVREMEKNHAATETEKQAH